MTLIKINIENKDKVQQKSEILNKLNKIQKIVDNDINYNELVYNIVTNATLHKKNIKVNLDNYGNYKVIDSKNKILSGGLFNSNVSTNVSSVKNSQVAISTNNKNKPTKPVQTLESINTKKNLTKIGQEEKETDEEGTEHDDKEEHDEGGEENENVTSRGRKSTCRLASRQARAS